MSKLRVLIMLFAGIAGVSSHRLVPATQPPFSVTGIVESVDAQGLRLRHKSGQRVAISYAPQTAFTRQGRPAAVADVRINMRIVVLYHFVDGTPTADEIRLFRSAAD